MRRTIDTAPRDGTFVILEDDGSGSFEFAQWSAEARGWVRENGKPSEITPTHWQTRHLPEEGDEFLWRDEFIPPTQAKPLPPPAAQEPRSFSFPSGLAARARATELARLVANADPVDVVRAGAQTAQAKSEQGRATSRWFTVSSIAAVMAGAMLVGWYFHDELAGYVSRYSDELKNVSKGTGGVEVAEQNTPLPVQDSQKANSLAQDPALRQQVDRPSSQAPGNTAQVKQGAEKERPLEKELRRADVPAKEVATQPSPTVEAATAELRQSLQQERDRAEALAGELAKARRDIATQLALSSKAGDEALQVKKAAESATAEFRQSLQKERDRAEALTSELAEAKREIETQLALSKKAGDDAAQKNAAEKATAELRQSLQKERDRTEALNGELAKARRDIETQLALSSKAGDEAQQVKKAAESAAAELRHSLQKERDRAEALTSELAKSKREIETQVALSSKAGQDAAQVKKAAERETADVRSSLQKERERTEALASELTRAKKEIETQVALSRTAGDEAAQFKKLKEAAEGATAELLRQSLQQERNRAQALAQLRKTTPPTDARIAVGQASTNQVAQPVQTAEAAATATAAVAKAPDNPEAVRLLARASALLAQGNIGAARIVLERAAETGSAQASFMLAETYDPLVLSTWKTYGTRGDATKARELYEKADAGGIQAAKSRADALR
ncbi:hypothetical protein [Bradyrhizobium sp. AUGA SZCCT0182]|uniref:hypothetical protein n=1 Tax=Bradyrhizobium sp. AUGA SZCCT0182 TaxID=2807667 RepID=UPI001BA95943|nr:hypothetical protein [Bradyrhizobium sp. AUGA SZCCT0182]MBR1232829.1 hypothetical protein [Bradyrhizobium sp. AUGA SZCCT0182]